MLYLVIGILFTWLIFDTICLGSASCYLLKKGEANITSSNYSFAYSDFFSYKIKDTNEGEDVLYSIIQKNRTERLSKVTFIHIELNVKSQLISKTENQINL